MLGNAINGTKNYTTNGLNQYISAGADTLSYNPRGLLNYNGPWAYTYEINDRLTTASKNVAGAITSGAMAYDAEGRLRQTVINLPTPSTSTRNLLHDGVNLVADYDATDTMVRRYVHGPGVDEPLVVYEGAGTATKNWQYADHLGSIIATADSTGTSTAIYTYGPFGESSLTTGIRYGYTGQRSIAALGLLYYKARFYSPSLGRFLQPDPIGYADNLNLYAYVGNNPVNFGDPSGLVRSDSVLLACALSCAGMGSRLLTPPAIGVLGNADAGVGGYDARKDIYTPPGQALADKMATEIEGITGRNLGSSGEVYSLRASREGEYPSVRGGTVTLQAGDVYKFGETTQPGARYSVSDLRKQGLEYQTEFKGSQGMAKIVEKMRIYGYFFENGALPPGNRIFR